MASGAWLDQVAYSQDTISTAVPAGPGTITGRIDPDAEVDSYSISVVAGQTYLVSLRGVGADALNDPLLELFNNTGTLLIADDDGGLGINSLLTFTATYTGDYRIEVQSFSSPGQQAPTGGDYQVEIRQSVAPDVPDTFEGAVQIDVGTTFGFIESGAPGGVYNGTTEVDTYKVDLVAGQFYTFNLSGGATSFTPAPGEVDTILFLYGPDGSLITFNDDGGSDPASGIGYLAEQTGTYYLDATAYQGQTGGYTLDVSQVDLSTLDPLDAIDWRSSDTIDTVTVNGVETAKVYFAVAGENFGETQADGPDAGTAPDPLDSLGWTDVEKGAVMSALQEYTKILGINYEITTNSAEAEFRLITTTPGKNYGAYMYPQDEAYGTQQGISAYNTGSGGWNLGRGTADQPALAKGGFAYAVILHEMGHGHGLAHAHDTGGGSDVLLGVTAAQNSYGVYNLNQGVYTVMSYNDAWDFHPDGGTPFTVANIDSGWSGTLGAFDIAMLQKKYGTEGIAFATGNDVYTLSDNNDRGTYYETIYDTGGKDTIAYGGSLNAQIDLTAATLDYTPTGGGVLSFVDSATARVWGGYTIANGVVIENATGGSGNDALIGNAAANTLTGNSGNDTLLGRDGSDKLLGGAGNDVLNGGAGKNELTGGAGNDTFVFDDISSKDKIRDFDTGNDMIDLTAFGVDSSDVKITADKLFVDTDGIKGYDLTVVIEGDRVQMNDILFASSASGGSSQMNDTIVIV